MSALVQAVLSRKQRKAIASAPKVVVPAPLPKAKQQRRKAAPAATHSVPHAVVQHAVAQQHAAVAKIASAMASRVSNASTQAVKTLATAMGLPSSGATRFPTQDMARTSVACLTDETTATSSTVAPAGGAAGDVLIAFYGQPGRLAMIHDSNLPNGTGTVMMQGPTGTATNFKLNVNVTTSTSVALDSFYMPALGVDCTTTGSPHGLTQTVGMTNGIPMLWFNSADSITVAWSGASTLQGFIDGTWMRYNGPGEPLTEGPAFNLSVGAAAGSQTVGAPPQTGGAYWNLRFDGVRASTGTIPNMSLTISATMNYGVSTGISGWRQISMQDLDPNAAGDINIVEEGRANASSVLITNVTSMLNRQGMVLAARIRQVPFWRVTNAILGRAAEKYQGDACNGCYTFFEFSDNRQVFRSHNNDYAAVFDLDYNDYYHFIRLSNPGYATQPNQFAVKFDTILEFKTDIARYGKGTAHQNFNDLVEARRLINGSPIWFYENPSHASDIYGFIKAVLSKTAKGAKHVAPYLLNGMAAAHPEYAVALKALAHAF